MIVGPFLVSLKELKFFFLKKCSLINWAFSDIFTYQYWSLSINLNIKKLMYTTQETSKIPHVLMYTGWQMLLLDVLSVTLVMQWLG